MSVERRPDRGRGAATCAAPRHRGQPTPGATPACPGGGHQPAPAPAAGDGQASGGEGYPLLPVTSADGETPTDNETHHPPPGGTLGVCSLCLSGVPCAQKCKLSKNPKVETKGE